MTTKAITLVVAAAMAGPASVFTAAAGDIGFKVPGTTLVYRPYIEIEGGYDSNPDSFVDKAGSAFEKIEGGLKVVSDTKGQYYGLTLKGRDVYFDNLALQNRWDFKAAVDTSYDITDSQTVKFGSQYYRDFFNLERANIYSSYAEYQLRDDEYRFKIEGKNHVEQNLNSEARGTLDQDVFNISKSEAFDYSRTDAKISLIAFTKSSWLQPFVIGDLADISYFNQSSGASIDRNADERYGIAGVRLKFDESFRIDIGARHNMRDFKDRTFDKFDSTWFDLNVYWQPSENFKVTAVAERFIDEPSSSFGLADDVRTTGMTVDWKFFPLWKLSTAAFYDRVEAIGDDFLNNKYVTTMSLTYEQSDHVQYFLSGLGKWVKEDFSGESYERYKIGAGVRYTF